jgi:MFS family permease
LNEAWPSARRAWGFIALLFLAGLFSVIDRAVLNVVVDPVRHDLAIGDEQIGLLQGLAFGLFYAFMGLPMGLLADRKSRRNLVAGGIALWSLATFASGLAQSFGQIFAARLLVGLGEAALSPAAISLIADLFPPERRGRPLSVFMLGQSLANGLAIALTGLILAHAASGAFAHLPLVGGLVPWRLAFVLFGSCGLLVAALMLLCREPQRRGSAETATALPGREELRFLIDHRGVLVPLYLGFAVCFAVVYGAAAWSPAMLTRQFGATPGFFASFLGPVSLGFAVLGPLLGGWLLDRSMKSGQPMARFKVLAMVPAFAIPAELAVLAGNLPLAALLVASAGTVFAVLGIVMLATLQAIVPPRMRGAAVSLTLVLNTVIGATLGPLAVATITERVLGDPAKVGSSIALFALPCLAIGMALYALARRNMARDPELSALLLNG